MPDYARRTHQTTVTLEAGQTKTFRLPPMTPGQIVLDATVPSFAIRPIARDHRAPAIPARVAPSLGLPRAPMLGIPGLGTGTLFDDGGGHLPTAPTPPTDLTMELLHGARVVATSKSHIFVPATTKDDAWDLRLTRASGGSATQMYIIEANYPSCLPIVERRISPVAFQRAFDANWNQHQYVKFEVTDNYHLKITFDEQFRQLYDLTNRDIDLGVPAAVPNMSPIRTTDIRFSIGHDLIDWGTPVLPSYQVPFVRLHVTLNNTFIDARFYITSIGNSAGYLSKVSSPIFSSIVAQAHGLVKLTDITSRIEHVLDQGQGTFDALFRPWLCGEAARELFDLRFDTAHDQIVVKYVGRPPAPSQEPVVAIDPTRPAPVPDPNPRLFDTPDEVPLPPPPAPMPMPGSHHVTSVGALAPIENIVVLMMENRSFDQVLGYLSRDGRRPEVDGLSASPDSDQFNDYDDGHGAVRYRPQRCPETKWFSFETSGPCHEDVCVANQMFEGNKHYVSNFARRLPGDRMKLQRVMDYFGADQLPAYAALAESFGICDRWYCSHVGPTWPNRFVTFTGDLNLDHLGEPERNQPDLAHLIPITRKTVFDHLSDRGVSWKVYEHGYSFLRLYGKYTFDTTNVTSFTDPTRGFVADARAGRLPQVTFIEPDYIDLPPGNDDHPPGDMADGQRLVATIASALMESPQWERTLFVITYDEAGGFYDHHVPGHGPPLFGGLTQYGPRVPTFVVSPLVAARSVSHTVYDHTTIISTILRRFCSPNPPHMSPRADAAADLRDMILPAARPRSEFAALRERLVAVRNTPPTPRIAPPKLKRWTEGDDFHTLLGYVRSLT